MTLAQYRQELQSYFDAAGNFSSLDTTWETARRAEHRVPEALELTKGVANSVKSTKFGENCAVYAAMGYVPRNRARFGLTRKRDSETPKATDRRRRADRRPCGRPIAPPRVSAAGLFCRSERHAHPLAIHAPSVS